MPRLSGWFIRAALIHLALGFTIGALMLANKGVRLHPAMLRLLPLHIEFLLMGWTMQLALGVAFWILPRFLVGRPRGNERIAWLAFGLLNSGVWLVALGSLLAAPAAFVLAGRLAEVGAAVAFGVHLWPRILSRIG
jgi:hypothetical protein